MSHQALFILNDPPYGSERVFNGLRLVGAVASQKNTDVRVFVMGDSVGARHRGPEAAGRLTTTWDRMIASCARHGADIGCCSTCLEARGITMTCSPTTPAAPPWRS